ncbi:MAG: RNA polymerase factor sigma-32 [Nitrospirae bacterium]|nr:RNA polymerase factor sigma-32 [Nitrospirota bacterium]
MIRFIYFVYGNISFMQEKEYDEKDLPEVFEIPAKEENGIVLHDPLKKYLSEIRKYPFLSREEEVDLARRYKEYGDAEAVSNLILSNLRLVYHIALEYRQNAFPLMDLIQEGNIGLMAAIKKFDPYKGIRVGTYASWWIRAFILRYILNNFRLVKVGTTQAQRKLFFNLQKEKQKLLFQGYDPEIKLLADHLQVKEKEVVEMDQRMGNWEVSLDAPLHEHTDEPFGRSLPSGDPPLDDKVADEDLKNLFHEKLLEFAKTLNERDSDILHARILSENPLTLLAIARKYHISKERARQLEEKILKNMKNYMEKEIKDFKLISE